MKNAKSFFFDRKVVMIFLLLMENISKHLQVNTHTTKTKTKMLHHLHYYKRTSDNSAFQNDLKVFSSPLEYAIDLSTITFSFTSSRKRGRSGGLCTNFCTKTCLLARSIK